MSEEKAYIKGFNDAYWIEKHDPELAETLHNGMKDETPYKEGFEAGREEAEIEKLVKRRRQRDEFRKEQSGEKQKGKTPDRSKDQDRDIDLE